MSCFEESLVVVKNFIKKVGEKNVILISKYKNPRDLYMFKRVNNFTCSVYNIIDEIDSGLIAESNTFPFIFILDKSLKTRDLFVIRKGNSKLTNFYLENIYTKYYKFK